MLCSACQSIFRGPLIFSKHGLSKNRDHHLTAQSFAQAIRQNCYICDSTFQQYQRDKASTLDPQRLVEGIERTEYYFSNEDGTRDPTLCLFGYGSARNQNETLGATEVCASAFCLVEANLSEEICQFASNTASASCWKLANQWLSSCLTNHVRCTRILSANPYHPTRVIEVAPLGSDSDDELHLRIAGKHSPEVPYMTLSHCWGKSEFLKLTARTFQRLRDGFSRVDTLSKTFQDAVTICQELGVKYLWIDSLCIFQDSPEDWRYEAARMEQVYGNSLCNIAATGASNGEEGCFRDRDTSFLQPCIIKSEWDNQKNRTWELVPEDLWDTRINQAPLNRRGWVMQERWLAPRVLHYGIDQLLWECCELDACEKYPNGLPKPLMNGYSGFKLDPEVLYKDKTTPPDPAWLYFCRWNSIVDRYSVTSLTKEEDKLVAISGIAKRMQGLLDDEYLAGLWRRYLPSQLLWTVDDYELKTALSFTRPMSYRAPSWSWASIDGKVWSSRSGYDGVVITVLDVRVTPIGPESTGQIKDGFIRLNGRIFLAELFGKPMLQRMNLTLRINSEDLYGWCKLDTQFPAIGTLNVYFLLIRSKTYENEQWLYGLILQAAARGNGTYERIGVYTVLGEKSCSILLHSQADKDESLYENADGKTIVLI